MPHSIGRLSISVSSHPGLSLAAFITNIAESDFRYTQGLLGRASSGPITPPARSWPVIRRKTYSTMRAALTYVAGMIAVLYLFYLFLH